MFGPSLGGARQSAGQARVRIPFRQGRLAGIEESARTSPTCFVWVRSAIDWSDEAVCHAQVKPEFLPHIARWNETFTIPYHLFRHEVSEIARLNLSRVAGAEVRPWREIPDGALVLPVDDDDWFAPDIVSRLRAHLDPDAIGYRWTATDLERPTGVRHWLILTRRRLRPSTPLEWYCGTNNYAIVKGPATRKMAEDHCHTSEVFLAEPTRVVVLPDRLNVVNRTLASQTSLFYKQPTIPRPWLLVKYHAYRRLYAGARLDGVEWAREYVGLMDDLMRRLERRA